MNCIMRFACTIGENYRNLASYKILFISRADIFKWAYSKKQESSPCLASQEPTRKKVLNRSNLTWKESLSLSYL